MTPTITPVFEAVKGKRRKMRGYSATTVSGYTLPNLFDTYQEAYEAANNYDNPNR